MTTPSRLIVCVLIACWVAGCNVNPIQGSAGPQARAAAAERVEGVVTGLNETHGNVYTSIEPDRYRALGLEPGVEVTLSVAGRDVTMPVRRDYVDVPVGQPVAVLHREGLTFAIRDGNFSQAYGVADGAPFTLRIHAR